MKRENIYKSVGRGEWCNHSIKDSYYFYKTALFDLVGDVSLPIPHHTKPIELSSMRNSTYLHTNTVNEQIKPNLAQPCSWNNNFSPEEVSYLLSGLKAVCISLRCGLFYIIIICLHAWLLSEL